MTDRIEPSAVNATALPADELDRIARDLRHRPRDDAYPPLKDRLRLHTPGLRYDGTRLIVPDGPWHVHNHPNRRNAAPEQLDPEVPSAAHPCVDPDRAARWRSAGWTLDQYARPIHPHWRQLLGDPRIGLPTGTGYFWRYGRNTTVDAAIYRRLGGSPLELLLIRRARERQWALPGGFGEPGDLSDEHTARREAGEETGLDAIGGHAETIARSRDTGSQATLHAWTENTVVLIHGDQRYLYDTRPVAGDDALDAAWFTPDAIDRLDLYGSHRRHIDTAVRRITSLHPA